MILSLGRFRHRPLVIWSDSCLAILAFLALLEDEFSLRVKRTKAFWTMPSRKKERGRKNRAKKEATRTVEQRSLWEPTILLNGATSSCEHMMTAPLQIPQEGPAISFMNYIASEGVFGQTALPVTGREAGLWNFCSHLVLRFPGVQEEDNERALAINLLLRFLRNALVRDSDIEGESWIHNEPTKNEVAICCIVHLLELIGTYSELDVAVRRASEICSKLIYGNRRDVIKFAAKRLPCTCLKELQRAARKKVAKVGLCFGCHKRFPRSQLHVCTGCQLAHYCSKECQRANWSRHKEYCGNPEVMSRDLPADYKLVDS